MAGNLLLTDSTKALSILTEEKIDFSFESYSRDDYSDKTIIDRLEAARSSSDPESVRVFTDNHFMVLKDFKTSIDKEGSTYISQIEVLNPLKDRRTKYTGDEIKRFDIFKTEMKNKQYVTVGNENEFVKKPYTDEYFLQKGFPW